MTSRRIAFTRVPQKCVAIGKQLFWEAVDLGGDLRVLDLTLTVLDLSVGAQVEIGVLTSVQDDTEEGWATLGTFPKVQFAAGGSDQTRSLVMVGALRYVRFHVVDLSGGTCYFTIEGEARTRE